MGAEMERVQQERDAALKRLAALSSSSEAADEQLTAVRKQLRQVEVRSPPAPHAGGWRVPTDKSMVHIGPIAV